MHKLKLLLMTVMIRLPLVHLALKKLEKSRPCYKINSICMEATACMRGNYVNSTQLCLQFYRGLACMHVYLSHGMYIVIGHYTCTFQINSSGTLIGGKLIIYMCTLTNVHPVYMHACMPSCIYSLDTLLGSL